MSKRAIRTVALALLMGVALAAAGQAGNPRVYREGNAWVEESSGALPSAHSLRVDTAVGAVRVQGGAGSGTYTVKKRAFVASEQAARREFEDFRINVSQQGDTAVLRAEFARGDTHRFSADFVVQVPREQELVKVETRGGSIGVNNIAGRVESETAGGAINLDAIGGTIVATTMGGSIGVGTAGGETILKSAGGSISVQQVGGRLMATTYGGSVDVGTARQAATVESMGGTIHVRQTGGDLHASTAGGNIDAGDVGGAATLRTAGGSIRLASAKGAVQAETAGGGITLLKMQKGVRAATAAGGIKAELLGRDLSDSVLQTTAGDITVYLASNVACSVRAAIETASGHRIRSDFPELKITAEGSDFGPRHWDAQGALNGGGPVLKLRTSVGDIEILRGSAH